MKFFTLCFELMLFSDYPDYCDIVFVQLLLSTKALAELVGNPNGSVVMWSEIVFTLLWFMYV